MIDNSELVWGDKNISPFLIVNLISVSQLSLFKTTGHQLINALFQFKFIDAVMLSPGLSTFNPGLPRKFIALTG